MTRKNIKHTNKTYTRMQHAAHTMTMCATGHGWVTSRDLSSSSKSKSNSGANSRAASVSPRVANKTSPSSSSSSRAGKSRSPRAKASISAEEPSQRVHRGGGADDDPESYDLFHHGVSKHRPHDYGDVFTVGQPSHGHGVITTSDSQAMFDPEMFRPKRICLVRHGESAGNIDEGLYAKIADNQLPLTSVGLQQAYAAGKELREVVGDEDVTFYVSPYVRTRQTYMEILRSFDPKHVTTREEPRLREQDFGNFQNVQQVRRCRQERRRFGSFYYRFPQGESGADVYDRVSTFIETLHREFAKPDCSSNIVLVSHGLTSRLFLMRFFHWEVEFFHRVLNLRNCEIVEMLLGDDNKYVITTPLRIKPPRELKNYSEEIMALTGGRAANVEETLPPSGYASGDER